MDNPDTRAPLSPVVAAALEQRQGERAEDALCAESDRMTAAPRGEATELRDSPDGVILARRAAGVSIGEEFAITRELARRRRLELHDGIDPRRAAQQRAARAKGGH